MDTSIGLIIKKYMPRKQKLTILDPHEGMIECITQKQEDLERLHAGCVVQYDILQSDDMYQLGNLNIVAMPEFGSEKELFLFYHVLELSYYGIPLRTYARNVFDMLMFLLYSSSEIIFPAKKQLFLAKFFTEIGVGPENDHVYELTAGLLEDVLEKKLERSQQELLDTWILACIEQYYAKDRLKTIALMESYGAL